MTMVLLALTVMIQTCLRIYWGAVGMRVVGGMEERLVGWCH